MAESSWDKFCRENGIGKGDMGSNRSNKFNFNMFENFSLSEWMDNASEITRIGHEIFECVARVAEKPKPVNFVREGFKIANILVTKELDADEYFYNRWQSPFSWELNDFIVSLLKGFPVRTIKTTDKNRTCRISNVYGEEVGWINDSSDGECDGVYVKIERLQEGREVIKRVMWEKFGDKSIVLRKHKTYSSNDSRERVMLEIDDAIPPLKSETAIKYAAYLKRCIEAGVPRSLLFYGPPGTGKSTAVRAITDALGMRTLRIRVEDIGEMDNSLAFEVINVFKPDAIILDDLDRANMMSHLLEMMEHFQRHVKVIMATVNDKDELGEAMLRPGRFDELIEVKYLDDEVIKHVLTPANLHLFDQVKKWPIKYIEELVTRRRFLSEEEAMSSLIELRKRVKRLDKYNDPDDEEEKEEEETTAPSKPVEPEYCSCKSLSVVLTHGVCSVCSKPLRPITARELQGTTSAHLTDPFENTGPEEE